MKLNYFIFLSLLLSSAGNVHPQSEAAAPKDPPEPSGKSIRMAGEPLRYLDYFRRRSRENISKLKHLVDAFESDVPGSRNDFTAVQEDYRKGLHSYYLNEINASLSHLEKAFNGSNALLSKYSDFLKKGSIEILREAASSVTERDLAVAYDPAAAKPGTSDAIMKAQFRIRMGYQQMQLAEDARNRQMFDQSVDHYRLARLHGITVLMDLEDNAEKRKAISEKYKKDLSVMTPNSQADSGLNQAKQ